MSDNDYSQILPGTAIELESQTTNPVWGRAEAGINTDENASWEKLKIFTRDLRLGNIHKNIDDLHWVWDRMDVAAGVMNLRNGAFHEWATLLVATDAAIFETSQSRMMAMRKNVHSVHKTEEGTYRDESKKGGFLGFGGNKNKGM